MDEDEFIFWCHGLCIIVFGVVAGFIAGMGNEPILFCGVGFGISIGLLLHPLVEYALKGGKK